MGDLIPSDEYWARTLKKAIMHLSAITIYNYELFRYSEA